MSQAVYRELHPPTAVTHCVEAYFTHAASRGAQASAPNLVLARGTRIEVYCLNNSHCCATSSGDGRGASTAATAQCRLELVSSGQCWGVIEDLAVLRGRSSSGQRDSLVIAVRDAKVSVVEWDDQLHCLRNGSLHYFEGDLSLREGCTCGTAGPASPLLAVPPRVAADPQGRCAAALVFGKHLALLPAIQADVLELILQQEGNVAKGSTSTASVGNSYLINLAKVLKLTSDTAVRAMTFLHEATEPTLLVLHETAPTWAGRLREMKDTCRISALSINLRKKRHPVVWHEENLPSDCADVLAVPGRTAVLVLSQNLLLYYARGSKCVMTINSNAFAGEVPPRLDPPTAPTFPPFPPRTAAEIAAATAAAAEKVTAAAAAHARQWATNVHPDVVAKEAKGVAKAPGLEVEADCAVGCWLSDSVALLGLKTGQLLLVSLRFEGQSKASRMQVVLAGSAPVSSCATILAPGILFLGSAEGDSLLVRYGLDNPTATIAVVGGGAVAAGLEPAAKRRRLALASTEMGGGVEGGLLDLCTVGSFHAGVEPGRGATGRTQGALLLGLMGDSLRHSFKVLDSLMCLGPFCSTAVADLHFRESDVSASLTGEPILQGPSPCLVAAVGADKSGALAIMRRNLVADVITAVPHLNAHGAWTLVYSEPADQRPSNVDAISYEGADVQAAAAADGQDAPAGQHSLQASTATNIGNIGAAQQTGNGGGADPQHAFLLLSCGGATTMVLDARGQELAELTEEVSFVRDAPTLAVGEMFGATAAVQVTKNTVRLVSGSSNLLQDLSLSQLLVGADHPATHDISIQIAIRFAQVRDPYVLLLLSDATVLVLQGNKWQQQLQLLSEALPILAIAGWQGGLAAVTAACLYVDSTGWFAAATGLTQSSSGRTQEAKEAHQGDATAAGGYVQTDGSTGQQSAAQDQQQQQGVGLSAELGIVGNAADQDEGALMAEAAANAAAAGDGPSTLLAAQPPGIAAAPQRPDSAAGVTVQPPGLATAGAVGAAAAAADTASCAVSRQGEVQTEPAAAAAGAIADGAATVTEAASNPADAAAGTTAKAADSKAADTDSAAASGEAPAAYATPADMPADISAAAAEGPTTIVVPAEGDSAASALEGIEGVDAAMAVAAAAGSTQEAAAAAAEDTHMGGTAAAALLAGDNDADQAATTGGQAVIPGLQTPPAAAVPEGQREAQQQRPQQSQDAGVSVAPLDASAEQGNDLPQEEADTAAPLVFCCVARADGGLQMYGLPSMTLVFEDAEAVLGHQVLSPARPPCPYEEDDSQPNPSTITELIMECFAKASGAALGVPAAAAPLLVLLTDDGACLVYKAYKSSSPGSSLGFRHQPLDPALLGHESRASAAAQASAVPGMPASAAPPCRLVRFDGLVTPRLNPPLAPGLKPLAGSEASSSNSGATAASQLHYSGFFMCGPKPVWLIVSRGSVIVHPMESELGAVDAFCAFHNVNCPHGYIAASLGGNMNICTLPLQLRLDQPWLTAKLPLRAAPQALTYYPEAHLLAVTTSRLAAPPRPFLPADPGGDAVAAAAYATAEAAAKASGVEDLHELQLLAPPGCGLPLTSYLSAFTAVTAAAGVPGTKSGSGTLASPTAAGGAAASNWSSPKAAAVTADIAGWAGLPMWRYSLLPGENATALKYVALTEGGDEAANPEPYIAVGCTSSFGEDYPALGRVLLFQIKKDHVFRLEGGSETKILARMALQREHSGPITALESLKGFLIVAVGHRLEMQYKQGNTLVKVTFIDGPHIISSISLVKDYMLVGHLGFSCSFIKYKVEQQGRERSHQLMLLSSDSDCVDSCAAEFMPNPPQLTQVMADGGGNIHLLMYDKTDPESWAGKKLMRRGAAHAGAHVLQFQRLRMAVPGDANNKQALLGATTEGGLLLVNPFWDEHMFKRMASLHEELVYRLQHTAGLNPKAFQGRYARCGPTYEGAFNIMKPVKPSGNSLLQGDLLWMYAGLDARTQAIIAEGVGVAPTDLLQDLRLLSVACDFL